MEEMLTCGTTQTVSAHILMPLYPTITRSKRPFFWFAKHEKRNHDKEFFVHVLLKLTLQNHQTV